MGPDWLESLDLPSPGAPSLGTEEDEGLADYVRAHAWAAALVILLYVAFFTPIFFAIVGVVSGSFLVGVIVAPILGLVAAGALGRWQGFLEPLNRARTGAPLAVRLLAPLLLFAFVFALGFVLLSSVVASFVALVSLDLLLSGVVTGAVVWLLGIWNDVPERTRAAPLAVRLLLPLIPFALLFTIGFVVIGRFVTDFRLLVIADAAVSLALTAPLVYFAGLFGDVSERTRSASLPARLALPLVPFTVVFLVGLLALGGLLGDFRLLVGLDLVVSALVAAGIVYATGLWSDVPDRIRASSKAERLVALALIAVLAGLLASVGTLVATEQAIFAFAALLPGLVLGLVGAAWAFGWADDAREAVIGQHFGIRVAVFVVLLALLTVYFALLVGPLLPNALLAYGVGALAGLAILVPASMWVHTWRDLWEAFVDVGEDRRVLATLPILPLGIGLVFLLVVVATSMFELAYVLSVPAGLALFLLAGLPFGITQDIPRMIRARELPARTAIFATIFLLAVLYAYFAVALFVQIVEVALVAGLVFAGLVLAGLIHRLDLGEGMVEEFEDYGALGEAAVLGGVFLVALGVTFLVLALSLGDFRIAFLVSVLVAAGVNYVVAHATGLVEGTRRAVAQLPWWAELLSLSGVFVVAFLFGTVAIGSFVRAAGLAMLAGAVFALASVVALSRDLEIGEEIMDTADERKRARTPILVLGFLGGFLVGLYLAAAAFQAVGVSLFGLPFFVALLVGGATVVALSRRRGWDENVLARVRTRTDKAKTGGILLAWLLLGVFTGFALQAVPIEGPVLGIGDPSGLPLTLTLAGGLFLWAWLPVVLFRLIRVERTPVDATRSAPEKQRTLASLGWGLLVAALTMVILLTVLDRTVLSVGVGVALGYLTALLMGIRGGREPEEG